MQTLSAWDRVWLKDGAGELAGERAGTASSLDCDVERGREGMLPATAFDAGNEQIEEVG